MAIKSSFHSRLTKPYFLKDRWEKFEARIDKFMKFCALHELLEEPQQKIWLAKFLMDPQRKFISEKDLVPVFGNHKVEQLIDALNHQIKKVKAEDYADFIESLEIHLVKEVFGNAEANKFYIELNQSLSFSADRRIQALENRFQSLQPPTLHNRSTVAALIPSQASDGIPLASTSPAFSSSDRSEGSSHLPETAASQKQEENEKG
jgi:hypothetical protein